MDRAEQSRARGVLVTEPEVLAADTVLRRHGIRYVVVGGQAVAQKAATTTHDVDVMVATQDFRETVARLRIERDVAFDWEDENLARFRILPAGGVPLDVLNSSLFSGKKSGEAFFRFLLDGASSDDRGISYCAPEAVWYTRLLTKRWKAYAEKIVTNVIDGLAPSRLHQVEEIGRQFGTDHVVGPRITYVRAELARPEIRSLLRGKSP
jgi:hypothetical protein